MLVERTANRNTLRVYAAYLPDLSQLYSVSSGGVFWALARHTIEQHGVVYGVEHQSLFDVHHGRAESLEQCVPFRRSKYLESNTKETFRQIKADLEQGRQVLFTGTGCQVAGLYGFFGCKTYPNLVTAEVVCHGVPSMNVFKTYIHELEALRNKKVQEIIYRDKSRGWNQNCIRICFTDGTSEADLSSTTPIHRGYLSGYYSRPSCGGCRYASLPRAADITLADYWQYKGGLRENNQNLGISLVVCSSEKGVACIEKIKHELLIEPSSLEEAVNSCRHLSKAPEESKYRNAFLSHMKKSGFHATFSKFRRKESIARKIAKLNPFGKLIIKILRNKGENYE
ncbi:Coenzyme F420 hydrogenase/dehydrogenase, beta subunit C-terminal domain [Geovibrio thiophilus]|nr:Coenzyme F420 hydrogenase/dehydrogenase, beta subunit C-terminal domain [Geovibrio thiophilus]